MSNNLPFNKYSDFFLYAKGWYAPSSLGVQADLMYILSKYGGIKVDFLTTRDLTAVLWEIFVSEYTHQQSFSSTVLKDFVFKVNSDGFLEAMIFFMRNACKLKLSKPDYETFVRANGVSDDELEGFIFEEKTDEYYGYSFEIGGI